MLQAGAIIEARIGRLLSLVKKEVPNENEVSLAELKMRLKKSALELNAAIDGFNNVTDPRLIDVYIYKIQSEQMNYDRLISEIKKFFEKY